MKYYSWICPYTGVMFYYAKFPSGNYVTRSQDGGWICAYLSDIHGLELQPCSKREALDYGKMLISAEETYFS